MKNYCVGVDVGGTTVKMGLFDITGSLMDKWEIVTRKEDGASHVFPDIAASIRERTDRHGLTLADLTGVGMGIPGPVEEDGYVGKIVNIGLYDLNPAKELSALLDGVPVKAGNDANVAALGEAWLGGAQGYQNVVMFTLGTGVGGGIVMSGQLFSGSHGMGGELGHMTVNPAETEACNCGNHGCLEQYASATGVVRVARRQLMQNTGGSVLRDIGELTAKDVFDAAKSGDAVAMAAVEELGRYLGLAMSWVALTVDPEVFIIGGGVSRAGQILLDVVRTNFEKNIFISDKKADVALATLGNDAGICGAAKMVL
ncbi:ROK family glucokinase [Cuneatibacter caecimuris]|uniref:Glucokinase n=1 Tax=Cuneatibacter caecimuris TaxID=1796618 RepID=A0A4V2F5V0_9FIRM|nr:glucokinase [Cuneatibacter caecimuris]